MVLDDRRAYPMMFFIQITLEGELQRDCFEEAYQQALERHPLLRSRLIRHRLRLCWSEQHTLPDLIWQETVEFPDRSQQVFDLWNHGGLKTWVSPQDQTSRVLFQFHHAVCDGVGAIQFIGDLLACYGILTASSEDDRPELLPIDPGALRLRGQLWDSDHPHPDVFKSLVRHLSEIVPVSPAELKSPQSPGAQSSLKTPFVSRIVDGRILRQIKKYAATQQVTPNEIYCAGLFETLLEWNQRCGRLHPKQAFRVGMPFTLRTTSHQQISAANVLSYVFITQRVPEIRNYDALLKTVHHLSQEAFDIEDRALMAWCLAQMQRCPGLLSLITQVPYRFCTAMLANVADVKRQLRNRFPLQKGNCVAGNVVLTSLQGAAPIRPGTHLGISVGTYAGKLFINLNCDPQRFSQTEADQLADLFVESVSRHCVSEKKLASPRILTTTQTN